MIHVYEEIFFWLPVVVVTLFWAIVVALACRQSKSGSGEFGQHPVHDLPPLFWTHDAYEGSEEPLTPDDLRRLLGNPHEPEGPSHFNQEGGFLQN